jgi:hypothetical protein
VRVTLEPESAETPNGHFLIRSRPGLALGSEVFHLGRMRRVVHRLVRLGLAHLRVGVEEGLVPSVEEIQLGVVEPRVPVLGSVLFP